MAPLSSVSALLGLLSSLLLPLPSVAQVSIKFPLKPIVTGPIKPIITAGVPKFDIDILPLPEFLKYPFGSVDVSDPEITNGKTIKVPLPAPRADPYAVSAEELREEVLNRTLPLVMSQFGFSDAQIKAKIAKALPAVSAVLRTLPGQGGGLAKRSFWDDLVDALESAACGVVAASALPVFLAAEVDFDLLNHNSQRITPDQQFFANPLYKGLAVAGRSWFQIPSCRLTTSRETQANAIRLQRRSAYTTTPTSQPCSSLGM